MPKTRLLLNMLLLIAILTACSPQAETPTDPNAVYTMAAATIGAQMTAAAALTPSATWTPSPEPTQTPTETPPPSPTSPPPTPTYPFIPAGKVVAPILLYNRIAGSTTDDANYQWDSTAYIPPEIFEQQIKMLKDSGYQTVTVSQIADVIRNGGNMPERPIAITFDIGAIGVYSKAYPIMRKYGYVGTVYLIVNQIDGGWMMTTAQIQELLANGWEIGIKGLNGGINFSNGDLTYLADELATSKQKLEEKFGIPIKSVSYPFGYYDEMIVDRVVRWGYLNAVTVGHINEHTTYSIYALPRHEIRSDMNLQQIAAYLPWPVTTTAPEAPATPPSDTAEIPPPPPLITPTP
ncbi:MAG: polysaccharide deacetylase family protein [Anaerolineae bacterium]|nr:polysaccharide deacetylase family protein [Anaerolineae bacterium]